MDKIQERFQDLPLRTGVGIILLNKKNKVFVAKRIDNPKIFGRCLRRELMMERII